MQLLFPAALLVLATAVGARTDYERARAALQNPDLFQGDILGFEPGDRNVHPNKNLRWTNRVVPYVIDNSLRHITNLIHSGMQDYHSRTCIRFVPRTNQRNYVKMFYGQGCYSYIGMLNQGEQVLSLGDGCHWRGLVVHELGHAIGFFHEQNRSDRDQYLIIYWNNIQQNMQSQFALLQPNQNILMTPFDHDSIMLYGNYAFSKDGRSMTMEAKNGKRLYEPYERQGMTNSDVTRVNRMYGC